MPSDSGEWSVPAPLQALFWWPPMAFVLALVAPDAAAGAIALAGAILVAVGSLAAVVGQRLRAGGNAPDASDVAPLRNEGGGMALDNGIARS